MCRHCECSSVSMSSAPSGTYCNNSDFVFRKKPNWLFRIQISQPAETLSHTSLSRMLLRTMHISFLAVKPASLASLAYDICVALMQNALVLLSFLLPTCSGIIMPEQVGRKNGCCNRLLLAHSANFIKSLLWSLKYFWWGAFAPSRLLRPGATGQLPPACPSL